ncbi:MAG: hypothetical protein R6U21_03760 [Thermoplasmatota archaeon]
MERKLIIMFILLLLLSTSLANGFPLFTQQITQPENNFVSASSLRSNTDNSFELSIPQPIQKLSELLNTDPPFNFLFNPQNITLEDDAYQNTSETPSTEWWYFDATLSEDHTVQFSIHLYDFYDMNFITLNLNIYHQGTAIVEYRTMYRFKTFEFSETIPLILKNDDIIMKGEYDEKTDSLMYTLTYSTFNASIDLHYQSITQGWKGKTPAGGWAVPLPQATVNGTIHYDDKTISVEGTGYHDHNWNVTVNAGLNFGWIWGKTTSPNYAITWSNIMTTWFFGKPLLVVNQENNGYYNIPTEALNIAVTSIQFKNGFIIPYGFIITAQTETIDIDLIITVKSTDYSSVLGIINYWRYHIHTSGSITVDHHTEEIDDHDIAEFIRFRFY